MDERLSDILATCLQRIEAGASVDDCLAAYPAERTALEPLLRVASRLRALPHPAPLTPAALAAVAGRVSGSLGPRPTASSVAPGHGLDAAAALAGVLRALGYGGPLSRPWLRFGAAALAVLFAVFLATTAYAAVRAVFSGPAARGAVLAPATRFELEGSIEAFNEATIVIDGITLDLGPDTEFVGTPGVGLGARATGRIRDDGTLLGERIVVDTPLATATPTPATPIVEPTVAPTVAPTAPATPTPDLADPLVRLLILLEAARADGRAGDAGDELIVIYGEARRALLEESDPERAAERLRFLYIRIELLVVEGRIDRVFADEVRLLIIGIGDVYGIRTLPEPTPAPPPPPPPGSGGGDDDDNDNDNEGGDDDDDD